MSVGKTVLVVEDDPTVRATLTLILESEGDVTASASNGREALLAIAREPPDVVLLDLHMPIMTGWELIAACGSDPSLCQLPLIVMSAGHDHGPESLGDVRAILPKPFAIERLLDVVEDALG